MLKNEKKYRLATKAIHAGQKPDETTGAIMVPIYASSTYVQESPGKHKGYEYSRTQNPTRAAYEKCIADLESGEYGFAFASGMSAADAILGLLKVGDEYYGGHAFQELMLLLDKKNNLRMVYRGNSEGLVRKMSESIALLKKEYDKESVEHVKKK